MASEVKAPEAKQVPHNIKIGDHSLEDPYFWLRDDKRKDKEVIAYLDAENAYTDAQTEHLKPLETKVYDELIKHLKEDDSQVPYKWGAEWYYSRNTIKGKDYPVYVRSKVMQGIDLVEPETVLDVNQRAEGHSFLSLGAFSPSPNHNLLAFSEDTSGYETYEVFVKDLTTGQVLESDRIPATSGSVKWCSNTGFFYSKMDDAHRPFQLMYHKLGTSVDEDLTLFTEKDEKFWLSFYTSQSGQYLIVDSASKITSEVHVIDLSQEKLELQALAARTHGVELESVDHGNGHFWIVSNEEAQNFKLLKVADTAVSKGKAAWEEVIPHSLARKLDSAEAFKGHIVVTGRQHGLQDIEVLYLHGDDHKDDPNGIAERFALQWPETAFECGLSSNKNYEVDTVRVYYSSMITPDSWFEFNLKTRTLELLKEKEVPNYDRTQYACERTTAKARDGVNIPISMVYRKDMRKKENNHALLYAYGSYGICIEPDFDMKRLPLLDRGVTYYIAHIRGGGEMGRHWYETGKFLFKKNTFNDFIDAAAHLIASRETSAERLAISGGSAGGLLMGAVVNDRPELFKAMYTRVPFVDIMATMSDPSIPLTVVEYEEWGNPAEEKYYEYMLSYSPMNNIKAQDYPSILITTGLNDSRVAYWEPAKWVARLRKAKTDDNPLLIRCKMDSGHGGASARYTHLKERAFEFAFILDQIGCNETKE